MLSYDIYLMNNNIPRAFASVHSLSCVVFLGGTSHAMDSRFPIILPEDREAFYHMCGTAYI